jgi:hypothetical protein
MRTIACSAVCKKAREALPLISKGFLPLSANPCDMDARGGAELMDVPLELTPGEEEALTRDRALTTDSKGRLTLVGLTVEESIWYIEHKRQWLAERMDDTLRRQSRDGRKRYLELYERHEFARLQVIGAEHDVRTENPTKN